MLEKYWAPFVSGENQFPKYSTKLAAVYNKLKRSDAMFFQACLIWRIFSVWTPQRSGRIASLKLNETLFYNKDDNEYIFKELPGKIFATQRFRIALTLPQKKLKNRIYQEKHHYLLVGCTKN